MPDVSTECIMTVSGLRVSFTLILRSFYQEVENDMRKRMKWHTTWVVQEHARSGAVKSGQQTIFSTKRDSQAGLFGSLEIMIKVMMTTVIVVLHFPHFVDDHQLVLLVMIITVMTVDFKYNNELLRKICDKILEPQEQKET